MSNQYAFLTRWRVAGTCGEVADIMVETGIGRVPIIDHEDRRVIGIISRQDLLKVRSRQKEGERRQATD